LLRRILPVLLLTLLLTPTLVRAQIINTLRGFADDEPGWSGSLNGYFNLAGGNTEYREYGGAATLQYLKDRHRFRALGSVLRKESRGANIAQSSRIHVRHNYWFLPRWASILFVQDSSNPFQRLDSRFLLGAGARYDLVRDERVDIYLGVATMLEEDVIQGDSQGREREQRMSSFLSVLYDLSATARLDVVAFYQPVWSDFADYRTVVAAQLKVMITGSLYLTLDYGLQHDNRPPEGVLETDWNLGSGIGWDF
jgi:putative salt-induced outer membrane protein YdiY